MTPFQWLVGGFLFALILGEAILQIKSLTRFRISLARTLLWVVALICVAQPGLLQTLASTFRIGRGTDLLLYGVTLCFLFSAVIFAHIVERHRKQITQLVQELAQKDPYHVPAGQQLSDQLSNEEKG